MQNTTPVADSARVRLARAHVGMTGKESRAHALGMADFIEAQQTFVEAQHRNIQAREVVVTTIFERMRMVDALLNSGRAGPAKRMLSVIVATDMAHPVGPCPRLPADLFAPVNGAS